MSLLRLAGYDNPFFARHTCRNAVVVCQDFRFVEQYLAFLKARYCLEAGDYNLIAVPGPVKDLVLAKYSGIVHRAINISVACHQVENVFLSTHIDCAAEGGSAAFDSPEKEMDFCDKRLHEGREILHSMFPSVKVICHLIGESDFFVLHN